MPTKSDSEKTIEAGLLLAQKWAERKRHLLVIVPANLRKQWSQELADKFHLPSVILEKRSFNEAIRAGNLNPFKQDAVILCSYQFARSKEPYLLQTPWALVIIDEAHRLRNVYKLSNKIANAIKQAVAPFPKVLLTATPLQNSLLELYGLVSGSRAAKATTNKPCPNSTLKPSTSEQLQSCSRRCAS